MGAVADKGFMSFMGPGGGWVFHKTSTVGRKIEQMLYEQSLGSEGHTMLELFKEGGVYNYYLQMNPGSSIVSTAGGAGGAATAAGGA